MNKVVLDGISDKMFALVHNGEYGAINTAYPTTMGYYVFKFLPEQYILQDNKIVEKQAIKADELVVKSEYISMMKTNKYWYWQQLKNKEIFIIATYTIVNPCLDVSAIKDVAYIPISSCNKK